MRRSLFRLAAPVLLALVAGCAGGTAAGWRLARNEQGLCVIVSEDRVSRHPEIAVAVGMTMTEDFSTLQLIVFRADYHLAPDAAYEVELDIDQRWRGTGIVEIIEPTMFALVLPLTTEFFDALVHGSQLRIHGRRSTVSVALSGTAQAIPALVECMAGGMSGDDDGERNPFGEPASPGDMMPEDMM